MALSIDQLKENLTTAFGDIFSEWDTPYGLPTFTAPRDKNLLLLEHLRSQEQLGFSYLTDICAVHYPDRAEEELCVVYHLQNLRTGDRLRMKVYAPVTMPDVNSATALYDCANWMERETYDFYGVNFIGHPNLRRILNVDEMDYFPLRKEFPLEDQSRIDKDDEMFGRGGTYN